MKAKPFFKSQTVAIVVGGAAIGVAWFAFYDAYGRRNQRPPFPIRLVTPS